MEPKRIDLPTSSVLLVTCFASSVVQLDVTIVNVALQRIDTQLGVGVNELQWVVNAYTLAFAVLLLSAGAFGDRWGSRRTFIVGMRLFALASLACGLAPTIEALILARAVQGAGAALLVPSSLAQLRHAAAGDARTLARSVTVWAAVGGASFAAGPVIGGFLLAIWGWPSIFFVNIPACMLGLALASRALRETPKGAGRSFDWLGQGLAALGLVGLVGGSMELHARSASHPLVVAALAIGAVCLAAFLWVESRTRDPVLPLNLFRDARVSVSIGFGITINLTYCGAIFILSLYLQSVLGYSTVRAGLAFIPLTATFVVANLVSGRLLALAGPALPLVAGGAVAALGYALLVPLDGESTFLEMLPGFLLIPAGMGTTVPAIMSATLAGARTSAAGTASATLNAARQVGGALGVALAGSLLGQGAGPDIIWALHVTGWASAALLACAAGVAALLWPSLAHLGSKPESAETAVRPETALSQD